MIKVTAMNGTKFVLNAEHIEKLEEIPETVITLVNGKKYIVLESCDEVIGLIVKYKNRIFRLDQGGESVEEK